MSQVVHALRDVSPGCHVVTIGNFDGVHRGHQHLLSNVVQAAKRRECASLVITFDPLPLEVLRPDVSTTRLTTIDERVRQILATGIDEVVVLTFNHQFATQTADQFLDQLVEHCAPVELVVGNDFAFGHKRAGTVEYLRDVGPQRAIDVTVVERVNASDHELSSSAVRRALATEGDVHSASEILGRPFRLGGIVENGAHRGRDLGYPTANLALPERIALPADGIYVGLAYYRERDIGEPSLVYVGRRPTFEGDSRIVEVHLLSKSLDLYGEHVDVEFLERLRGDMRFDSADELVAQMNLDEDAARQYFGSPAFDAAVKRR